MTSAATPQAGDAGVQALDALESDPVVQSSLGEHIAPWYLRAKRAEWDEYRIQVSQWELDRYLSTL